jgi:hypothetical protein
MEKWRDVIDYEGFYEVSNLGRVRSVDRMVPHGRGQGSRKLRGQVLQPSLTVYGHQNVNLSLGGVEGSVRVHKLVALAWLGPYPEGAEVCHGPLGKTDNSVANLSYGTRSDNLLQKRRDGTHGGHPVRRSDGVEFINLAVGAEETPKAQVTNILKVCKGLRKSCGGYGWEFIE